MNKENNDHENKGISMINTGAAVLVSVLSVPVTILAGLLISRRGKH